MLLKSFRREKKSTKKRAINTTRCRFEQLEPRMMLSAQAYDWNNAVIKGQGFVDGMVYSQAAPNTFFAHTDIGGAYRWDPSASNWIPVTDWIQAGDSAQNLGAQAMAADPTDANRVYSGHRHLREHRRHPPLLRRRPHLAAHQRQRHQSGRQRLGTRTGRPHRRRSQQPQHPLLWRPVLRQHPSRTLEEHRLRRHLESGLQLYQLRRTVGQQLLRR